MLLLAGYVQQTTYHPETGFIARLYPSWIFHRAHLARWMTDISASGICIDNIQNMGGLEFVHSYAERARELFDLRYHGHGDPAKFLVIGKNLKFPVSIGGEQVVGARWNNSWQARLRAVIIGEATEGDSFVQTVQKVVDCRLDRENGVQKFTDGAEAINYITDHDMNGFRKERLYDFLTLAGVKDASRRAKVAFALLLTSVGIPMIFAGEEFADTTHRNVNLGGSTPDTVNYAHRNDAGWREMLFGYVAALVRFRTSCPALGQNDTKFFHIDGSRGGRIMSWQRVGSGPEDPLVVIVANLSDEDTPGEEYIVPGWPEKERPGWREITQNRPVPAEWVGREPLYHWEVKVYTCWKGVSILPPAPLTLHRAVRENDIALVQRLISDGAPVNETDSDGKTALSIALELSRPQIAQTLIQAGADTNVPWDGSERILIQHIRDEWTQLSESGTELDRLKLIGMPAERLTGTSPQGPLLAPPKPYLRSQWEVPAVLWSSRGSALGLGSSLAESWPRIRDRLSRYLTVTGSGGAFECSTCKDFLNKSWGKEGLIALNSISVGIARILTPGATISAPEETQDEWRDFTPLPVLHVTREHILIALPASNPARHESIMEAVNWICSSVRPPPRSPIRGRNQLLLSETSEPSLIDIGQVRLFGRSLVPLRDIDDQDIGNHPCWTSLFRTVVVSRHRLPSQRWGFGLELSYKLLQDLAATHLTCFLEQEAEKTEDQGEEISGVLGMRETAKRELFVLTGFFTALIPTRWEHSENRFNVQWHLVARDFDQGILDPRSLDFGDQSAHVNDLTPTDLERTLHDNPSTTCFLGWCDNAHVLLGTRELQGELKSLLGSGLKERSETLHPTGYKLLVSGGVSGGPMAPGSLSLSGGADFAYKGNIQQFDHSMNFDTAIRESRTHVALVYDKHSEQSWLVPKLSLVLHLCHVYIRQHYSTQTAWDTIPFAEPHSDGSLAVSNVLSGRGNTVIREMPGSSSGTTLAAVFLMANTNLTCTPKTGERVHRRLFITKIFMAELRDMVIQPLKGSPLREFSPKAARDAWKCLSDRADVSLACSGIGQAIRPAPPPQANAGCRCTSVASKKGCIIAHMHCLNELAKRMGKDMTVSDNGAFKLNTGAYWHVQSWLLSCPDTQPQHMMAWDDSILQRIVKREKRAANLAQGRASWKFVTGAVVFGDGENC